MQENTFVKSYKKVGVGCIRKYCYNSILKFIIHQCEGEEDVETLYERIINKM